MAQVVRDLAARLQLQLDKASFDAASQRLADMKRKLDMSKPLNKLRTETAGYRLELMRLKEPLRQAAERERAHARAVHEAARARSEAVSSLKRWTIAAGVGAYAAGHLINRAFVQFNSNIEQSTISLAAQERLMGKAGTWQQAMGTATGLFTHYQNVAKASVGTTTDFLEMHQAVAASAYAAGLNLKQVKELTKGGVIAGSTLGFRADETGREIQQMIAGSISTRDRLSQLLLKSQNISAARFRAMSKKQRAEMTLKAFSAPAFQESARAMEGSYAGALSTLQDNLQITLGKVGLPLFKSLTAEVQRWNTWIEKNPEKIKQWGDKFSRGLERAFTTAKEFGVTVWPKIESSLILLEKTVHFLAQHKWLLYAFTGYKVAKVGAGLLGGLGGAAGGTSVFTNLATAGATAGSALTGLRGAASAGAVGMRNLVTSMGGLSMAIGKVGLVAGTALAAWEVGRMFDREFGIGDKVGGINALDKQQRTAANAGERTRRKELNVVGARHIAEGYSHLFASGVNSIQVRGAGGELTRQPLTRELAQASVVNYLRKRGAEDKQVTGTMKLLEGAFMSLPTNGGVPVPLSAAPQGERTRSFTVNNTINVDGTIDPEAVAIKVDERLRQQWHEVQQGAY